jgi:hypothetical protein
MISSLREFDNITAAGILARAALSLEDECNPAAANKFPNESFIRENIIKDVRINLGISPDDMSITALDKLGDALDSECNALLEEPNTDETLQRLADKGELPSDLYNININQNIIKFFGKKYDLEKDFIEKTVWFPDKEQHYGQPQKDDDPFLISLFSKYFPNKYKNNSFTMLVTGQRNGLSLTITQALRFYTDSISLEGVTDLIDMLRRFADKFGAEIEFYGKKGHFFLTTDIPHGLPLKFNITNNNNKVKISKIAITYYIQKKPFDIPQQAALVVAIDLIKYKELLKSHGW